MSSSPSASASAPKPMPMAIMRNAHEVIRGATKDIEMLLQQEDGQLKEATKLWHDLHRFTTLHMYMEEGTANGTAKGLFQMMDDHANGAATKAGLREQHTSLEELEQQVTKCLDVTATPNLEQARVIFPKFVEQNEAHLLLEEQILMPCVQQMIKGGHPVKKYILTYLMPAITSNETDMEFFITFANQVLERHEDGMPRVRVFDQALWAIAAGKPEQWNQWKVWIQQSLSPSKYENVMGQIQAFVDEQQKKQQQQQQKQPQPQQQPKWMRLMRNPVEC